MAEYPYLTVTDDGIYVNVHVQPASHKARIVGTHGDALKIAVAAPPVGGKANEAVTQAIADVLGVPAGDVSITSGDTGRRKRLFVAGVGEKAAHSAFDAAFAEIARPGRR